MKLSLRTLWSIMGTLWVSVHSLRLALIRPPLLPSSSIIFSFRILQPFFSLFLYFFFLETTTAERKRRSKMEEKKTKKKKKWKRKLDGSTNKPLKRFQCIIRLILSLFSATEKLYDLTFMVKKERKTMARGKSENREERWSTFFFSPSFVKSSLLLLPVEK